MILNKGKASIRSVLMLIFLSSIMLPVLIIMFIIPSYYRQQMTKDTTKLVRNNLETISDTIIIYLSDLQMLAALPYFNEELREAFFPQERNEIPQSGYLNRELTKYLKMLRKEILSIVVVNSDGYVYHYNRNQNIGLNESYDILSSDWYRRAIAANGQTLYIGTHNPDYFTASDTVQVFSMVRWVKHPYIEQSLGVIIVDADMEIFSDVFRDLDYGAGSISVLLDNNDNLLYASEELDNALLRKLSGKETQIEYNKEFYNVIYHSVPLGEWTIAVLIRSADIAERIQLIYFVGFSASLFTLLLTYLLFRYLTVRYVVRPIREMSRAMKEVENGNLSVRCDAKGSYELTSLGNNLNGMIEKLNRLIIKDYKLVISQKQAEYRALQARIKPHFLYNTLNGMIGLNRLGDRTKLEQAILDLTSMMRYSLSEDDLGRSTIEREFDFIREYCHLQEIRFEEKLKVCISVEDDVRGITIPKLLVQPLVENAVLHNVEESVTPVYIEVYARTVNSSVMISITDNGSGFEATARNPHSTGMRNVKDRLKMFYPDGNFLVRSQIGIGTTVTISFPLPENE